MAKNSTDILKEYLVSIGFQVDDKQANNLKSNLKDIGKQLESVAKVGALATAALTASVVEVARRLEQMYYSGQRTKSSIGSLQSFRFAAEQVGVSADEAQSSLEAMSRSLRINPGMIGLLKSLNINPNQEGVRLMMDLMDRLRRMPFYQGVQIAQMFGIDENTFFQMTRNLDQMKKFEAERRKIFQQAGIDPDKAAEKSHEFMMEVRGLTTRLETLVDVIAVRFLPAGHEIIVFLDKAIDYMIQLDKATNGWSSRLLGVTTAIAGTVGSIGMLKWGAGLLGAGGGAAAGSAATTAAATATGAGAGGGVATAGASFLGPLLVAVGAGLGINTLIRAKAIRNNAEALDKFSRVSFENDMIRLGRNNFYKEHNAKLQKYWQEHGLIPKTTAGDHQLPSNVDSLIQKYSAMYGVDPALAKAQAWAESRGNQNAISKKGALGVFQLMPDTARQLGVDPKNLEANVQGGIKYLSEMLKQYGGNIPLALAAYNAGGKNVEKYGGIPPFAETQSYVAGILQDMMKYRLGQGSAGTNNNFHQQTEITIIGSGDANRSADKVVEAQNRVNGDLVRNLRGVLDQK